MIRYLLILLLCASLVFGDQITQEVVGAGADDGEVLRGAGAFSATSTSARVGRSIGGNEWWSFFRFTTIPIPAGSTIDTAIFTPTCASTTALTTVNASCFLIDSANAAAPTDSTWLFNAQKTSARTYWANIPSVTANTEYRWNGSTGNITSAVAEVVALSGWASGNAMVIVIKDSSSTTNRTRNWYPQDNGANKPAKLDIYYTPPSGVPSVYHGVAGVGRLHSPAGNSVLHKK